jgi:lysophospholipase L1-like esterase
MGGNPSETVDVDELENANIVCDGNSLTYGYKASNPPVTSYPSVLNTLAPLDANGATVVNKGVNGQTTGEMIADAASDIDPLFDAGRPSILVAWEMGNDLFFNGVVADVQDRFESYCLSRKAAGWTVVVLSLPAREHSVVSGGVSPAGDNDAAFNIKRELLNVWLRDNYTDFADGLVDLDADDRLANYNETYFDEDKVHLVDAGYAVVAELVVETLLSLNF